MVTNNAINLQDQGVAYYDGAGSFTGIDGSTANYVLTSNGTGQIPTFQPNSGGGGGSGFSTVNIQVFDTQGTQTYTPTTNMSYAIVEVVGGGGGSAGAINISPAGGAGGGGGYSRSVLSAASIGVSQTVTVGAGGLAGGPGLPGSTGGTSSFGAFMSALGGAGGSASGGSPFIGAGGAGGTASGGDINITGQNGGASHDQITTPLILGAGGDSFYGFGRSTNLTGGSLPGAGVQGTGYGSGAGGSAYSASHPSVSGANGTVGVVIVTEFIGGGGGGSGFIESLTGDSGPAVQPVAGNANVLGSGSLTTVGSGDTLTASLTGLTDHNVLVGAGTDTIGLIAPGTAGWVLTSNGGSADPTFQAVSASGITTLAGNSGTATGATVNVVGSGSLTTSATGSTITASLTGLTNHALLVGAGTATITKVGPSATAGQILRSLGSGSDPAFSTATYPATTTANRILYSSSANVIGEIATSANGVLITNNSSVPSFLANSGTPGFVLTANSGAPPSWQAASSGGITTINGDTGSITGSSVTIRTNVAALICGSTVQFTNSGTTSTLGVSDAIGNTIIGGASGGANYIADSGSLNTVLGYASFTSASASKCRGNTIIGQGSGTDLESATAGVQGAWNVMVGQGVWATPSGTANGIFNTLVGTQSAGSFESASYNVVIGDSSASSLTTGVSNTIIGSTSGNSYTSSESRNICIDSTGTVSDSDVIRIGDQSSSGAKTACFIGGISGATVTGSAVLVDASGQLGDTPSSIRFKENIVELGDTSGLLNLRPVSFNYIKDKNKTLSFGLIAEEVEKIIPELVLYKNDEVYGVKYHELPALLINEVKRLSKRVEELEKRL